jgi:hypothetical protein
VILGEKLMEINATRRAGGLIPPDATNCEPVRKSDGNPFVECEAAQRRAITTIAALARAIL